MYLMYVDESGDTGLNNSPTNYFGLSGLVVHESRWRDFLNTLIAFKKTMRTVYGLPIRTEIHASEYIRRRIHNLPRHIRLAILRNLLDEVAKLNYVSITNIVVHKYNKPPTYDVFENAWQTLFQRFENTLQHGNFPGSHSADQGLVITDATSGRKLARLIRRMAVHNYVPHAPQHGPGARNLPISKVIEDPYGKDSSETLPIQVCDTAAYFLLQKKQPSSYIKRQHAQNYFDRLTPILNLHARSGRQNLGIVEI